MGDPIIETDQDDEPGNRAAHSLSPAYSESGCRCFPRRGSAGRSQPVPPPTRVRLRRGRSTEWFESLAPSGWRSSVFRPGGPGPSEAIALTSHALLTGGGAWVLDLCSLPSWLAKGLPGVSRSPSGASGDPSGAAVPSSRPRAKKYPRRHW